MYVMFNYKVWGVDKIKWKWNNKDKLIVYSNNYFY